MTFCTKKITMQNNQQLALNAQKPLTEMNSTVASYAVVPSIIHASNGNKRSHISHVLRLEGIITLGEPTFRGLSILVIVLNPKEIDDLRRLHWKPYDSMQNEAGKKVR